MDGSSKRIGLTSMMALSMETLSVYSMKNKFKRVKSRLKSLGKL